MNHPPFVIEKTVNATPDRVWSAITDPVKMKQWYFDIKGFKLEIGTEFTFSGYNAEKNHTYVHLCRVVEVIPQKKLMHTWRYEGFSGDSTVTWELFDEGPKTRVKLTHEGIETFKGEIHPELAFHNFERGWTQIVTINLEKYLSDNN